MHKSNCSSVRYVLLPESNSILPINDPLEDRTYLLHRLQILQMEIQDYKKREELMKKVNLALTDAMESKDNNSQNNIKALLEQIFAQKDKKVMENIKEYKHQGVQTEVEIKQNPQESQIPQNYFHLNIQKCCKNNINKQQQASENIFQQSSNFGYGYIRAKSPHAQSMNFSAFVDERCRTPSYKESKMTPTRRQFKRTISHFDSSITPRSSLSTFNRNIATDLLCDMCGVSFSPIQFLSHVQECQGNSYDFENFHDNEYQQQDGNQQLVQMLENRKHKLTVQIQKLKKIRSSPERKKRLQTDLDQIVFIIKNKKTLNNQDIKRLLKQKNYYEKCFI